MKGQKALDAILNRTMDDMFTSLMGRVEAIDKTTNKVDVQPLHEVLIDGQVVKIAKQINIPLLDFGSGGFFIRPPINVGDYVILIIIDYDIQNLVLTGQINKVNTSDIHSINDAVALPFQLRPFNQTLNTTDQDNLLISSQDGSTKITLEPNGNINIISPNTVTVDTDTLTVNTASNCDFNVDGTFNVTTVGQINLLTTTDNSSGNISINGWESTVTSRKP